jgi:hypothetical protein
MTPAKRRRAWLVAAALLLLAGALVLSLGENEPVRTHAERPEFPSSMRPAEEARARTRATLVLPAESGPHATEPEPARRDPFLVSLPVEPGDPVVVLEANALRHSRLGERFVSCLLSRDPDTFERIRREVGVDPLKDVDRVGFVGETVVMSGFFGGLDRTVLEQAATTSSYGDAGKLYLPLRGKLAAATWGDGLVLVGEPDALRRSLDQLEGRAPTPEIGIPEDMAYGEAYGVIPGDAVRRLFGRKDAELAQRIADAASRVELHVDAMEDVAAVVRVQGADPQRMADLARSIGAAMAVARIEAQANEDAKLAALLEHARVLDRDGSFQVELALSADRLDAFFGGCEPPSAGRSESAVPP